MLELHAVSDIYRPDKMREAELVYGANDRAHVSELTLMSESIL